MKTRKDNNFTPWQSLPTKISIPASNVHASISTYEENKGTTMVSSKKSDNDDKNCCTSITGQMNKKQWKGMARKKESIDTINKGKGKLQMKDDALVDVVVDEMQQTNVGDERKETNEVDEDNIAKKQKNVVEGGGGQL